MLKNIVIVLLVFMVLVLGGALLWQGALQDVAQARASLAQSQREMAEVKVEVETRKRFWSEFYTQWTSGAELQQSRASIVDGNPLVVVKGRDGKVRKFDNDGKSVVRE